MGLLVREGNGCWHVYDTATEPWALVTAFSTKEAADIYAERGRIRDGRFDVNIGNWGMVTLQESYPCFVCRYRLGAGVEAYVRTIRIEDEKRIDLRFQAKCLKHLRSRFERDDPL